MDTQIRTVPVTIYRLFTMLTATLVAVLAAQTAVMAQQSLDAEDDESPTFKVSFYDADGEPVEEVTVELTVSEFAEDGDVMVGATTMELSDESGSVGMLVANTEQYEVSFTAPDGYVFDDGETSRTLLVDVDGTDVNAGAYPVVTAEQYAAAQPPESTFDVGMFSIGVFLLTVSVVGGLSMIARRRKTVNGN